MATSPGNTVSSLPRIIDLDKLGSALTSPNASDAQVKSDAAASSGENCESASTCLEQIETPTPSRSSRLRSFRGSDFHKEISTGIEDPTAMDAKQEAEQKARTLEVVNSVVLFFIFINAILLGLSTSFPQQQSIWYAVEFILTVVWVTEATVKLKLLGRQAYFKTGWNWLDFILVIVAVIEVWVIPFLGLVGALGSSEDSGMKALSLVRLLRVVRIARVLETRRELVVLVEGLFASVKAMIWIGLFLFIVIYSGAIFCTMVIDQEWFLETAPYNHTSRDRATELDGNFEELYEHLTAPPEYFNTLGGSMLTLFNIAILDEWGDIARALASKQPILLIFFMCYVMVTTLGVLNLIIGVIVDRTSDLLKEMKQIEENKEKLEKVHVLSQMTDRIFENNEGLSLEELEDLVESGRIKGLVETIMDVGLPKGVRVPDLHLMFDMDCSGSLDKEEFLDGVYGMIFNTEFQRDCMSMLSVAQCKKLIADHHKEMKEELGELRSDMKLILGLLKHPIQNGKRTDLEVPVLMEHKAGADTTTATCENLQGRHHNIRRQHHHHASHQNALEPPTLASSAAASPLSEAAEALKECADIHAEATTGRDEELRKFCVSFQHQMQAVTQNTLDWMSLQSRWTMEQSQKNDEVAPPPPLSPRAEIQGARLSMPTGGDEASAATSTAFETFQGFHDIEAFQDVHEAMLYGTAATRKGPDSPRAGLLASKAQEARSHVSLREHNSSDSRHNPLFPHNSLFPLPAPA